MISILLAAYKSEDLLKNVFAPGLVKNTSTDYELIIYDNGGQEEFINGAHIISEVTETIRVIGDGKNIGLNAALNECAKVATGEWFYLPHTDMYLMPGWDMNLLNAVKNQVPGTQLLCSRSIEPTKGHTDFHIIKNYGMEPENFEESKLLKDYQDYEDKSVVTGYRMPFFMHKSLWERMNGVDSNYFSYCTDDDLVQTAYNVGVRKFWMINGSLVYHLQGKSNQHQSVDRDSMKPYLYFIDKWKKMGYKDAKHPGQWHEKLIPWYQKMK